MRLLDVLEQLGDLEAAAALEDRFASMYLTTDPGELSWFYLNSDFPPTSRMRARLTAQHARGIALTDGEKIAQLIWGLRRFGADQALAVILVRLGQEPLDVTNASAATSLLGSMPDTPEGRRAAERICHDAAMHAEFTEVSALASFISRCCTLGYGSAVEILLSRDLAQKVPLGGQRWTGAFSEPGHFDKHGVIRLIEALRQAGANRHADLFAARAANAGLFAHRPEPVGQHSFRIDDDFSPLSVLEHGLQPSGLYRYGRTPDGQPSAPWTWQDLLRDEEATTTGADGQ